MKILKILIIDINTSKQIIKNSHSENNLFYVVNIVMRCHHTVCEQSSDFEEFVLVLFPEK